MQEILLELLFWVNEVLLQNDYSGEAGAERRMV